MASVTTTIALDTRLKADYQQAAFVHGRSLVLAISVPDHTLSYSLPRGQSGLRIHPLTASSAVSSTSREEDH
ncbi:hypothetical protein E4U39_003538 [Claviceps sp. Clav50 group G5]|nr:hypothetical protein E4U39_003538 [Claviceps sp. Clav50 group G5]